MKALKLIVVFQVLGALLAIPVLKNITQPNDIDEVDTSWRLPKAIYPISYIIALETKVHDEGDRDFKGTVIIHLDVRQSTNRIVLHSKDLNIQEILILSGASEIDVLNFQVDETRDFLIIEVAEDFEIGADLLVLIEFNGQLQQEGVGFYRSQYQIDGRTRFLAITQFEAPYARYAFPVFDGKFDNSITYESQAYRKAIYRTRL